jgi:hypothetical protein
MSVDPLLDDDEQYASEEDSDFAPEDAAGHDSDGADSDSDDKEPSTKRKQPTGVDDAEDTGFENSGDEAIIDKGRKRRKKDLAKQKGTGNDEEGADEVLIKTRSMRAAE